MEGKRWMWWGWREEMHRYKCVQWNLCKISLTCDHRRDVIFECMKLVFNVLNCIMHSLSLFKGIVQYDKCEAATRSQVRSA